MKRIVLIAHNLRSCHNVGSLLRTADGFGVEKVFLTGYTPYPISPDDQRLPHLALAQTKQIHKTALGAEKTQAWFHQQDIITLISDLKQKGYLLAALEQTKNSTTLNGYKGEADIAVIVGSEVGGLTQSVLGLCDQVLEIPMQGKKESFNVASAAAIALYHLRLIG